MTEEQSSLIHLSDQSGLLRQKVSSHFACFGHNIKSECKLLENSEYFQSNKFFPAIYSTKNGVAFNCVGFFYDLQHENSVHRFDCVDAGFILF